MPRGYETARIAVKPEARPEGKPVARMLAAEAARIRERLPRGATVVALDERGRDFGTRAFSVQLRAWLDEGAPVAFMLGGADGLDPALRKVSRLQLRLSSLTLPHALAQVLLCEQLYRAASLLCGHPYHRE
jgi:23S rRNA (pseudouridine1915-N3)-methyltransferase